MKEEVYRKLNEWLEADCPETVVKFIVRLDDEGRIQVLHDENLGLMMPIVIHDGELFDVVCRAFVKLLAEGREQDSEAFLNQLKSDAKRARNDIYGVNYYDLADQMVGNKKTSC